MSINDNLSSTVVSFVGRLGFDVTIQQQSVGGAFDAGDPTWSDIATVKAVWDNPRVGTKGMQDQAPQSSFRRSMTVAYRDDLKDTSIATRLRVMVDGVSHNVLSTAVVGKEVAIRLFLDAGA